MKKFTHYLRILSREIPIKKYFFDQKKFRSKKNFDQKIFVGQKKSYGSKKIMAMDIIYKNETKLDKDNYFSIDLTSNNEIQNMMFRERDTWLV